MDSTDTSTPVKREHIFLEFHPLLIENFLKEVYRKRQDGSLIIGDVKFDYFNEHVRVEGDSAAVAAISSLAAEFNTRHNFFISLRLTDPGLQQIVENIHAEMRTRNESIDASVKLDAKKLHFTLLLMDIRESHISEVLSVLQGCEQAIREIMCEAAIATQRPNPSAIFSTFNVFGNSLNWMCPSCKVLYLECEKDPIYHAIIRSAELLHARLEAAGLMSTISSPLHATIAKPRVKDALVPKSTYDGLAAKHLAAGVGCKLEYIDFFKSGTTDPRTGYHKVIGSIQICSDDVVTPMKDIVPKFINGAEDLPDPPGAFSPSLIEQFQQWRTKGWALVDGLLPLDLIDEARGELMRLVENSPTAVTDDFGGFGFPFKSSKALNAITLHPRLLAVAKELLRGEVHLTQGEAWMKKSAACSKFGNQNQRMHMDYPNHTMLHPPAWDQPEVLALIVYLDNYDECGGPTALVEREGDEDPLYEPPYVKMPGVGPHEWINDKDTAEQYFSEHAPDIYEFRKKLYEKERYAKYNKGTVLLYRLDLWHRGTPIAPGQTRIVMNLGYKKAGHHWVTCWSRGWSYEAYDNLWGVVPSLSEDQKAALGIPREAHPWWQEGANRANVQARYSGQMQRPPMGPG